MPLRDSSDPRPIILIGAAVLLVLVVGPLSLGIKGFIASRRAPIEPEPVRSWDWKLAVGSGLLYSLAFNLTFFIQEFFLVLPKALTPGLRPILFHNNHTWTGANPIARLFQGTGALATLVSGGIFVLWLRAPPSPLDRCPAISHLDGLQRLFAVAAASRCGVAGTCQ